MLTKERSASVIINGAARIAALDDPTTRREGMKAIRMNRATYVAGVGLVSVGDIALASNRDADYLVAVGKASYSAISQAAEAAKATAETAKTTTEDDQRPQEAEPVRSRRRGRRSKKVEDE